MDNKEYYSTGKLFSPVHGEVYENLNGTKYRCLSWANDTHSAIMQIEKATYNVRWTFVAHGIRQYADGRIDWEHSTDGQFDPATD